MKNFIVYISNGEQYEIVQHIYSVIAEYESDAEQLAMKYINDHHCVAPEDHGIHVTNTIELCDVASYIHEFQVYEITQGFTE